MRVLAASSPIYAHALNARPFLDGLAEHPTELHWALPGDWTGAATGPAHVWDTGPVPGFVPRGGRVREVSARYTWLLADAATRVRHVLGIAGQVRPDVVLTDSLGYAAALAAERLGLPWVSFGDGPLHFPDHRTPPFGAGLPYRTARPWHWRNTVVQAASRGLVMRPAQRRYDALRADLGLPPTTTPVLEACLSPVLHLHCGAPGLEYPRTALPEHVHFVGPLRPPPPSGWTPPAWWEQVVQEHSGRVVLASQGTLRQDPDELLAPTLAALRAGGRPGVLTTGAADPALLGGPGLVDGAGGVASERFVPYQAVLPHASVFVTNGGWTGVLLALAHGVPVVQVGRTEEKADIGRRVAWAGAGLHLGPLPAGPARPGAGARRPAAATRRSSAGARRLGRALDRVEQDASFRERAEQLALELSARDPGRDGAELITGLAGAASG